MGRIFDIKQLPTASYSISGSFSGSFLGDGSGLTNISASIAAKDEGTTLTPFINSFDFVGNGVTVTNSGGDVTVTIPGGTSSLFPYVGDAVITGSLTVDGNGGDIFLIKSSSIEIFKVEENGAVSLTNNAPTMFLIQDTSFAPILAVSQSGVIVFATQSAELANPAPNGGLYFTSNSLFIGLD